MTIPDKSTAFGVYQRVFGTKNGNPHPRKCEIDESKVQGPNPRTGAQQHDTIQE